MTIFLFCVVVTIGYLSGSVCSAVIVSNIFALPDPRQEGSKNPGATNMLRLAGKKYAIIVLFADLLKGLLPVLLAKLLDASTAAISFTCFAAVMGHMYPIFFGFKGGKGVATALGALLGLHFIMGVAVIATWLLIANFSRYSSLASILSIILAPVYSLIMGSHLDTLPPLIFIAIFILYQHRENVTRLIDGEESKINLRHPEISDVTDEILNANEQKMAATQEIKTQNLEEEKLTQSQAQE